MPKRVVNLKSQKPLLNIGSYGRNAPGVWPLLTAGVIAHASRTARGVPEVMVRVTGGARTVGGVGRTLDYLEQEADLETDDGLILTEKGLGSEVLKDWNLELETSRRHTQRTIAAGRKPTKLVHNLVFSMPAGTPADKLRKAVKKFGQEKFALEHRYAMALHTHQGHPHVHMVVKAVSEEGVRLNIRKATLREWQEDFARYLREFGVEANATERAVRGSPRQNRKNGIHRAAERGASTFMRERFDAVSRELRNGGLQPGKGKRRLLQTRRDVESGWLALADRLEQDGMQDIANQLRRFVDRMPPARTDREWIAQRLQGRIRDNSALVR